MNFWLSAAMYREIEAIASYDARSMSDVLREAIRNYVEERRPQLNGVTHDGNVKHQ